MSRDNYFGNYFGNYFDVKYEIDEPCNQFSNKLFDKDRYISGLKIDTLLRANNIFSMLKNRYCELENAFESMNIIQNSIRTEMTNVIDVLQCIVDFMDNIEMRIDRFIYIKNKFSYINSIYSHYDNNISVVDLDNFETYITNSYGDKLFCEYKEFIISDPYCEDNICIEI